MNHALGVVLCRHLITRSYEYVAYRCYGFNRDQQFKSIVGRIFADPVIDYSGRLAGKAPGDLITESYEVYSFEYLGVGSLLMGPVCFQFPNRPAGREREDSRTTIADAFAHTVNDRYAPNTRKKNAKGLRFMLAKKAKSRPYMLGTHKVLT